MTINQIDNQNQLPVSSLTQTQNAGQIKQDGEKKQAVQPPSPFDAPPYELDISAAGYEMSRRVAREMAVAEKVSDLILRDSGIVTGQNTGVGNIDRFPINTPNTGLDIADFYANDAEQLLIDSGLEGGGGIGGGASGNAVRNPINTGNAGLNVADFYANNTEQLLIDSGLESGTGSGSAVNSYKNPINTGNAGVNVADFYANDDEQLLNQSATGGSATAVNSYQNPINTSSGAVNSADFYANDTEQLINATVNGGNPANPNAVQAPINTANPLLNVFDFNANNTEQLLAEANYGPQMANMNQQTYVQDADISAGQAQALNTAQAVFGLNYQDGYGAQASNTLSTRSSLMAAENDLDSAASQAVASQAEKQAAANGGLAAQLSGDTMKVESDVSSLPGTAGQSAAQTVTGGAAADVVQLGDDLQTAVEKPGFVKENEGLVERASEVYNLDRNLI
ncbi:MAG: hypothetical protein N3A57_03575 [Negativicutes bacterium]|nr:hypothetical protein [Negativicutes bacterium]